MDGMVGAVTVGTLAACGLGLVLMAIRNKEEPRALVLTRSLLEFVRRFRPLAAALSNETGIPEDFILAQASLESGNGSRVYRNNFFGIKAGPAWKGKVQWLWTWEHLHGKDVRVKEPFRAYSSIEEGWRDYTRVVQRIAGPTFSTANPEAWIDAVVRGGYATAPNYRQALRRQLEAVRRIGMA